MILQEKFRLFTFLYVKNYWHFSTNISLFTGGYCWAYNTRLYFGEYHPDFEDQLGWWLFADSLVGGSFGVFFGGWFSDRIVTRLGLHSRLWVLSAFTLIAVPFSCLTLYLDVSIFKVVIQRGPKIFAESISKSLL